MTLRIPEDLAGLQELAAEFGRAPAFVVHEPAAGDEWDGHELPVLRAELYADLGYIGLHTAVPAAGPDPKGALTFEEVLLAIMAVAHAGSLELFWVSSLRPLAAETDPELSRYAARLALPLRSAVVAEDPLRVAFLAPIDGFGNRTA